MEMSSDMEYPNAKKHWSTRKYKRKLKNIASVIHRIHSDIDQIPFIVGLAEVENKKVLKDFKQSLITKKLLKFILFLISIFVEKEFFDYIF